MSYTRKYVTLANDWYADDPENETPTKTGVVYFEGDCPSVRFFENLNIEEVNLPDGRWLLILGNEQWVNNDFLMLEGILMQWASDEGYAVSETFGPIDF